MILIDTVNMALKQEIPAVLGDLGACYTMLGGVAGVACQDQLQQSIKKPGSKTQELRGWGRNKIVFSLIIC